MTAGLVGLAPAIGPTFSAGPYELFLENVISRHYAYFIASFNHGIFHSTKSIAYQKGAR